MECCVMEEKEKYQAPEIKDVDSRLLFKGDVVITPPGEAGSDEPGDIVS